ncbi:MAG: substrate-binding domain-containing protein, partial [Planctomycetales bacterium]
KITRWNQVNPAWPDAELVLFGAGTSSGTFEYFTGAVTGKAKNSRGDYTASEEDNMLVTGIKGNKNALGYIPFAYYEPNKESLKALAVDSGQPGSEPVLPSQETVEQGKYTPFARPLFLYVSVKAAERPEVQAFVRFYLRNGARLAQEESYVPLPSAAYAMARERFKNGEAGTGFNGVPEFGLRVEEILSRPPKKVLE